jgi:DNA-binding transcriptional LysR family regulator
MNLMIVFRYHHEYCALMSLDLDSRLLRMFATLAREGSHTRTGEILNLTQSAISHGIKRLEEQLACTLIYNKGKTACLTPEGRHFLGQVLRILESLDRATDSVSGRVESRTKLSVVFSTAMAHAILAPVLREFRESYPHVSMGIKLEDSEIAVQDVEEGRSDLAIIIGDNLPMGLKEHTLFHDELQFLFSPLHPWAEKKKITATDLKDEHFLLYRRNSITFRQVEDLFLKSGTRLNSYVEIPSFDIMKQLAQLGLGIAIMAPWVAKKEIREGSLRAMPTPQMKIARSWKVIHQGNREIRQAELTFIGLCRMAVNNLILD